MDSNSSSGLRQPSAEILALALKAATLKIGYCSSPRFSFLQLGYEITLDPTSENWHEFKKPRLTSAIALGAVDVRCVLSARLMGVMILSVL